MREKRTIQRSIFEQYAEHEIGRELEAMSDWLDLQPELLDWVGIDLRTHPVMATGRKGLTIDSVLRCALLKQYRLSLPKTPYMNSSILFITKKSP